MSFFNNKVREFADTGFDAIFDKAMAVNLQLLMKHGVDLYRAVYEPNTDAQKKLFNGEVDTISRFFHLPFSLQAPYIDVKPVFFKINGEEAFNRESIMSSDSSTYVFGEDPIDYRIYVDSRNGIDLVKTTTITTIGPLFNKNTGDEELLGIYNSIREIIDSVAKIGYDGDKIVPISYTSVDIDHNDSHARPDQWANNGDTKSWTGDNRKLIVRTHLDSSELFTFITDMAFIKIFFDDYSSFDKFKSKFSECRTERTFYNTICQEIVRIFSDYDTYNVFWTSDIFKTVYIRSFRSSLGTIGKFYAQMGRHGVTQHLVEDFKKSVKRMPNVFMDGDARWNDRAFRQNMDPANPIDVVNGPFTGFSFVYNNIIAEIFNGKTVGNNLESKGTSGNFSELSHVMGTSKFGEAYKDAIDMASICSAFSLIRSTISIGQQEDLKAYENGDTLAGIDKQSWGLTKQLMVNNVDTVINQLWTIYKINIDELHLAMMMTFCASLMMKYIIDIKVAYKHKAYEPDEIAWMKYIMNGASQLNKGIGDVFDNGNVQDISTLATTAHKLIEKSREYEEKSLDKDDWRNSNIIMTNVKASLTRDPDYNNYYGQDPIYALSLSNKIITKLASIIPLRKAFQAYNKLDTYSYSGKRGFNAPFDTNMLPMQGSVSSKPDNNSLENLQLADGSNGLTVESMRSFYNIASNLTGNSVATYISGHSVSHNIERGMQEARLRTDIAQESGDYNDVDSALKQLFALEAAAHKITDPDRVRSIRKCIKKHFTVLGNVVRDNKL